MARTMQYLVSLSDETAEKLLELEKAWQVGRDEVIQQAIVFAWQRDPEINKRLMEEYGSKKFSQSLGESTMHKVSELGLAILKQTLDEGRAIHIPSLGITIEPERKEQ